MSETPIEYQEEFEGLNDLKTRRYNEIDNRTCELICDGFEFNGTMFSLSLSAQANWTTMHENVGDYTWPVEVSTRDDYKYDLYESEVNDFWQQGRSILEGRLASGRALKVGINDALDKAAVDAIVDER